MVKNWPMEKYQFQMYLWVCSTKHSRNGSFKSYKNYSKIEKTKDCSLILFYKASITLLSKPDKDITRGKIIVSTN